MIIDKGLSKLFCKETGKVVDNTSQPCIDDYIKWLESKVNNSVLGDVIKCDKCGSDDIYKGVEDYMCNNCNNFF
tara:strand:- start:1160 stop:1381 length:222 start_codon:yes stop_codon:yes gene_type:complete